MIVNPSILDDMNQNVDKETKDKAYEILEEGKVKIIKVLYDNEDNFEIYGKVLGEITEGYRPYIKVESGEIENLTCNCSDYKRTYSACPHILSALLAFKDDDEYNSIFAKKHKKIDIKYPEIRDGFAGEQNRNFKKLLNIFYKEDEMLEEQVEKLTEKIKIEPYFIYDKYMKELKLEIKIGISQMYKIKDLSAFYSRMQTNQMYKYGSKLEFIHNKEVFRDEDIPLLDFIMNSAEIINRVNGEPGTIRYKAKILPEASIVLTKSKLDEIFSILENQKVEMHLEGEEKEITFVRENPELKFTIEEINEKEYIIKPTMKIYEVNVIEGTNNSYILTNGKLYCCDSEFKDTALKLLSVFKQDFVEEIKFKKTELPKLFSMVVPKAKKVIDIKKIEKEAVGYIPKDLAVKVFLDFDKNNYITADVKFCYEKIEFNPIIEQDVDVIRNMPQEVEALNLFRRTGFRLDSKNFRFILVDEEKIYNFLLKEIEEYMQKFEVLATEKFKQKEIKMPKPTTIRSKNRK